MRHETLYVVGAADFRAVRDALTRWHSQDPVTRIVCAVDDSAGLAAFDCAHELRPRVSVVIVADAPWLAFEASPEATAADVLRARDSRVVAVQRPGRVLVGAGVEATWGEAMVRRIGGAA